MFNLRRKPRVRVWKVYTDGAIQPLYGISGVGAVVYDETGKIVHLWQGVARGMTCNEAEYTAVLFALRRLEAFRPLRLTVCSDSQVLVDQMTGMAQVHAPELRRLNQDALRDPRVHVENADAFPWLDAGTDLFDVAFVDFPDPSNFAIGKLYTTTFYRRLAQRLAPDALFVVQSTSPLFARQSFWCVVATVRASGLRAWPYHVYVPSFGEWGFVLAGRGEWSPPARLPDGLRYLTASQVPSMFDFPPDMGPVETEVNRLNNQALVHYYEREWSAVAR